MLQLSQDPRTALTLAHQRMDDQLRDAATRRQARSARSRRDDTRAGDAPSRARRLRLLAWTRLLTG